MTTMMPNKNNSFADQEDLSAALFKLLSHISSLPLSTLPTTTSAPPPPATTTKCDPVTTGPMAKNSHNDNPMESFLHDLLNPIIEVSGAPMVLPPAEAEAPQMHFDVTALAFATFLHPMDSQLHK